MIELLFVLKINNKINNKEKLVYEDMYKFFFIIKIIKTYLVPKILSPASPNPGKIYAFSFNFSSMAAQ